MKFTRNLHNQNDLKNHYPDHGNQKPHQFILEVILHQVIHNQTELSWITWPVMILILTVHDK